MNCANRPLTIAIDGPAGAGKSTIARAVAQVLNYTYVDTGAMYRAVALKCLNEHVDLTDHHAVYSTVAQSHIRLTGQEGASLKVELDGNDVTGLIRSPEVSQAVSLVAQVPQVREWLVGMQREMGLAGGVVMDGRDIGTVVLPEADVKVFLTASAEERARRRYRELVEAGQSVNFDEVLEAIQLRDALDKSRAVSPLRQADDAVAIDTTSKEIDEVVSCVLELVRSKGG